MDLKHVLFTSDRNGVTHLCMGQAPPDESQVVEDQNEVTRGVSRVNGQGPGIVVLRAS